MKKILNLPQNIVEAIKQMYNHSTVLKLSNGEQFSYMKTIDSIPIFTCISNLKLLSESSHLFADGTFSYAPTFFFTNVHFACLEKLILRTGNSCILKSK